MSYIFKNIKTLPLITCNLGIKQLQLEGLIVYEYNPLKVFRINKDLYIKDTYGIFIKNDNYYYNNLNILEEYINIKNYPSGILDSNGKPVDIQNLLKYSILQKNSLIDLDTELLQFDLNHPVNIITLPSYDGSVNLILNDGKHSPKLINSRFSTTGMDTYLIVDREGDNDTNIYDEDSFDIETSLYKKLNNIVKLNFLGLSTNGYLKVGNYIFYFKLADADGNETDFVAESGPVSCYIGNLNDPYSIRGSIKDERSFKAVNFALTKINSSYDHVIVYYSRESGSGGSSYTSVYKILEPYPVKNGVAKITITGFENTEISSVNDLNVYYNIVDNAKTLTSCQNMLFLGNVEKPKIPYKDLADLSLRIEPHLNTSNNIGCVNEIYLDNSSANDKYEYYNVLNIYHRLGYWNNEIYRLGIVYILNDYTLSPVFSIRGIKNLTNTTEYKQYSVYDANHNRSYIDIDKNNYKLEGDENSRGTIKINNLESLFKSSGTVPIGLKFTIKKDVADELKKYTKGFFFVRQRRIKTTFCLAVLIGLDTTSHLPVLPIASEKYVTERFLDNNRILRHDFNSRKYEYDKSKSILLGFAAICPEYEMDLGFFNLYFTGSEFSIAKSKSNYAQTYFNNKLNHFYINTYNTALDTDLYKCNIISIPDDVLAVKGRNQYYSSRAGNMSEATKVAYCGYKDKTTTGNNLIRGAFGPYLGVEGQNNLPTALYDIKIPNYDDNALDYYFDIRYKDATPFFAISERIDWDDCNVNDNSILIDNVFRGDCFICNYTHRMIRNFLDSDTPTNDEIIDPNTWKDNYEVGTEEASEKRAKINRSDLNAVKIGHWATIKVCSNINLSLRCLDYSYPIELGLTGKIRGFFPHDNMDTSGESRIPESFIINKGYNKINSNINRFDLPNVPAIKNKFNTRILYSDININDSFKNGFRIFTNAHYLDYPMTYGSITKLIEWGGNIICVCEHGVFSIVVNEKALLKDSSSSNIFINSVNVLTPNPKVLSDMLGSLWADSIIKTPHGVYGVDTVAKKIWKIVIAGELNPRFLLVSISDFKVLRFLNENITLTEKEFTPIIGVRNVKTHYNAFKNDIMFTFYDDINTLNEKAWNLCYNEILEKFITFYSWVPSYSENIDNIFFSFDRDTSKHIAKLYENTSIILLLESNIFNPDKPNYIEKILGIKVWEKTLVLKNLDPVKFNDDSYTLEYTLGEEALGIFSIEEDKLKLKISDSNKINSFYNIPIKAKLIFKNTSRFLDNTEYNILGLVALAANNYIDSEISTYFWKHGLAGLMKTLLPLKPCNWYGKLHPFEFEVIALDSADSHKIFTDLELIANKAEPESLHFEITGEVYNFASDKKNMYFRLEALKNLYQHQGGDIAYNDDYLNIIPQLRSIPFSKSKYKDRSTLFILNISRVDTLNTIEDYYLSISELNKDYLRLSGSEIIHDKITDEYKIATHIKACPLGQYYKLPISETYYLKYKDIYPECFQEEICGNIHKYYEILQYNRRNGNIEYKEDKWYMQIPSIIYMQKNELPWEVHPKSVTTLDSENEATTKLVPAYPPLNLVNNPLPESMENLTLSTIDSLPKNLIKLGYELDSTKSFDINKWETVKETRLRDRYLRIRIRYSGTDLALIYALKTFYTISFS